MDTSLKWGYAYNVEDGCILPGGEDHLGLQAGLEEEAVSRHGATSATVPG